MLAALAGQPAWAADDGSKASETQEITVTANRIELEKKVSKFVYQIATLQNGEGLARWRTTATLTPAALIFSAILSSIFFAWLHAEQVGHARGILVVLFCVSLVQTFVRVKTDSVAASAMVHGAYNFFVFLIVMIQTGGYRHFDRLLK